MMKGAITEAKKKAKRKRREGWERPRSEKGESST